MDDALDAACRDKYGRSSSAGDHRRVSRETLRVDPPGPFAPDHLTTRRTRHGQNPRTATVKTPVELHRRRGCPVFGGDGTSRPPAVRPVHPERAHQLAQPRQRELLVGTDGIGLVGTRDGSRRACRRRACGPGQAVQGRIVGDDAVAARLTDTPADEVHFQRYLAANCFATPSGAVASTWGWASCSRSRCSSPSAVQTLRCAGASTGTSRSATPARGCCRADRVVPFIGCPRTLDGLAALNDITGG